MEWECDGFSRLVLFLLLFFAATRPPPPFPLPPSVTGEPTEASLSDSSGNISLLIREHVRSRFSGRHLCIPSFPLKEFFFSGPFGKVGSGGQPPEPAGRFSLYKCCFHGEPVKTEEQAKVHFFALSLSPLRVEDKGRWSACPRGRRGACAGRHRGCLT